MRLANVYIANMMYLFITLAAVFNSCIFLPWRVVDITIRSFWLLAAKDQELKKHSNDMAVTPPDG
jgi:hypothetical protein